TWGFDHVNLAFPTVLMGVALLALWAWLLKRIVQARFGHRYRLTNRRLFVSTGLLNRRRDQMELLRVQDVYTKQSLLGRLLGRHDDDRADAQQHFPVLFLAGVNDPK